MKKRILSMILCICLVLGVMPSVAWAVFPDNWGENAVCYAQVCTHEGLQYTAAAAPTCTQQGTEEFWYCQTCRTYYQDPNFETPVKPEPDEGWISAQSFTIPALGHTYDANGICCTCGRNRPVYTQISTLEAFDALDKETTFLLVIKDGDKTYAAYLPDYNGFCNPCDTDSNGDGIVDALQIDTNENGIPDFVETLFADWLNADLDADGDIDDDDCKLFVADQIGVEIIDFEAYALFLEENYWDASMLYESQFFDVPNYVEVNMASDGSITLADEGALQLQMMPAGVWGGMPSTEEGADILETERIYAAWIPNYWIGSNGMLGYHGEGHFAIQYRTYGDWEYPGVMDHKNWKISFREDGSVCMVGTWEEYNDSGALQFVKYLDEAGNEAMTLVGLPEWLWKESPIMANQTECLSVYLYAAQPNAHIHSWDGGVQTKAPACTQAGEITYTCVDCGQSYRQQIPATGHQNVRLENSREANCGTEGYTGDSVCGDCGQVVAVGVVIPATGAHAYGDWEVVTEPTAKEPGLRQRSCRQCGHVVQEVIEPLGVLPGDVNGDGSINARDARALLRYIAGLADAGEIDETAADFNGDGKINSRDVREILRHIAGMNAQ